MHKQVIVLRKDLNMRKGKCVAQGAHAALGALLAWARKTQPQPAGGVLIPLDAHIGPWLAGAFRKICVYVDSESALLALYVQAEAANLPCCLITDQGHTEFHGVPTHTALAIGPAEAEQVDVLTGGLPLY